MESDYLTQKKQERVDWRRIAIYSLLAFVISGSAAIYIVLAGLQGILVLALVALWLWWRPPSPQKGSI